MQSIYKLLLRTYILLLLTGMQAHYLSAQSPKANYDYVNPFIGTKEMGHTFPGACVPFGMVQLSPETDTVQYLKDGKYNPDVYRYCAGYQYSDKTIVGFSHTHLSGTGHSDLGDFLIMPTVGKVILNAGTSAEPNKGYRSTFDHKNEAAHPGYYKVKLDRYNVTAELTATAHVGMHQYTFPATDSAHILLDMNYGIYNYEGKVLWSSVRVENDTLVTGYRITSGWARTRYIYFAMTFSKPIKHYGYKNYDHVGYKGFYGKFNQYDDFPEMAGRNIKAYFDFSTTEGEQIKIKLALSAVSTDNALENLRAEAPRWDFNKVYADAKALWEKQLNAVNIDASADKKAIFYTAMYHAYISPIIFNDVNGEYRGIDNNIHKATGFSYYTVFSLWDTYRALQPLYILLQPQRSSDIVRSMLAHYEQSVHHILPVWAHYSNENWCMIGYHSLPVIADAYVKGIRGFDADEAFKACVASANKDYYPGTKDYLKYGYAPDDMVPNISASITLEYAYDDFSLSQFAKALGKTTDENTYLHRAMSYQNVFDKSTGFMRAKSSMGIWKSPFDPLSTNNQGFIEGNAWNYSFYVPQDVNGYKKLLGGDAVLIRKLDSLFTMHLDDKYFAETEDVTREGLIGNYDMGNEPSHHIAYLYAWTSQPWKTQQKIRLVVDSMYRNTMDGICGNDDCGQMSAWYIFSTLGFYPVCPGTNQYVIGTPSFKEAQLKLADNKVFVIKAPNLDKKNIYIQSVTINGKPYTKTYIRHEDIISGGELVFMMGSQPNKKWGTRAEDKPFSISITQ